MRGALLATLGFATLAGATALALPRSAPRATPERVRPEAAGPAAAPARRTSPNRDATAQRRAAPKLAEAAEHSPRDGEPAWDFLGVFVAREATEVAALNPGRIASIDVRIGDHVRAGQTVATLDARAQELDLGVARSAANEARAELEVARSVADTAIDNDTRAKNLGESGLASGADQAAASGARRAAELRAASAEATLLRQEAAVRRLTRERDETLIRAPFDGVVVARYLDPGANVTPDRAILRVVRSGEMIVRFALPEERAGDVHLGTAVRAVAPGTGREVNAVVRRISPEVDAAARWFIVEADVAGDAAGTLVGEAADVFLRTSRSGSQ